MIPFLPGETAPSARPPGRRDETPGDPSRSDGPAEGSAFARLLGEMDAAASPPPPAEPAAEAETDMMPRQSTALDAGAGDPSIAATLPSLAAASPGDGSRRAGDPTDAPMPRTALSSIPWAARLAIAESAGRAAPAAPPDQTEAQAATDGDAVADMTARGRATGPAAAGAPPLGDAATRALRGPAGALPDQAGTIPPQLVGTRPDQQHAVTPAGASRAEPATLAAAATGAAGASEALPTPAATAPTAAAGSRETGAAAPTPGSAEKTVARGAELRSETVRERRLAAREAARNGETSGDGRDGRGADVARAEARSTAPATAADQTRVASIDAAQSFDASSGDSAAHLHGDAPDHPGAISAERTSHEPGSRAAAAAPSHALPAPRQIALAVAELGEGQTEIRLSPEELGRVRLTVSSHDTSVVVQIAAERPETADILRRAAEQLSQDLSDLGYREVSIEFRFGPGADAPRQRTGAGRQGRRRPSRAPVEPAAPRARMMPPPGPRLAAGHLDIRL